MIIQRLHIKNFGKLQNKKIEFAPGINLIYGENESGKSTLHTFIQGMFFGIRRMRGKASRNDTYSRYEPWENAAGYEGQMWFRCGEKEFRLNRVFQKERQSASLICETDGELLSLEDGDLDVLLGNISETTYHNTISVGQLKSRTEEGLVEELRNYVSNYQGTFDEELDLGRALRSLKEKKKDLEKQKREAEEKKQKQLQVIEMQLSYMRRDLQELKDKKQENQRNLQQEENEIEETVKKGNIKGMGIGLAAAVVFTGLLFGNAVWLKLIGVFGWVCLLMFAIGHYLHQKKADGKEVQKKEQLRQERYRWTLEQLQQSMREKQAQIENLQEEYEEILQKRAENGSWDEEIEAVALAMKTIQDLSRNMQNQIGRQLRARTSRIMAELTDGNYTQVTMDEDFAMGVDDGERHIPLEQLSKGTIEQIYFAFRMAMGEILCQEETMPVLLDDTFVLYDEVRTAAALRWLAREKEQTLIFTCQKREQEILDKLGISYHLVRLT